MNKLILSLIVVGFLSGCDKEEKPDNSQLLARVDSLETALEASNYTIGILGEIGTYMDSIDSNRKWIQLNLETGLSQDNYVARMKSINQYVKKAEWMIGELEKTRGAYATQVKRLKNEITLRDENIKALQLTVAQTQADKKQLQETLTLTETELKMSQIEQDNTESELQGANEMTKSLMKKVQLTQAESLFSQGENMEAIASYVQLAPRRKRAALEDALKYYTQSGDLGYAPATAKVETLKARLAK
jgi:chromosome segregation ATPase